MDYDTYRILDMATSVIGVLASLVLALAAIVVAVMVTARKAGAVPGWILAASASGSLLLDVVSFVLGIVLARSYGAGAWISWAFVLVRLANLVLLLAMGAAILVFRPGASAEAAKEVSHG